MNEEKRNKKQAAFAGNILSPKEKTVNREIDGKIPGQGKPKDSATSVIFENEKNVADVFNHAVFAPVPVDAADISDDNIKEISLLRVKEQSHTTLTNYRDVVKKLGTDQVLAILGIENQERDSYMMPFRVMELDFINYARQVRTITDRNAALLKKKKDSLPGEDIPASGMSGGEFLGRFLAEDRILPCITLVIYWGTEPWKGPRRLSEMFLDSPWAPYASDYEMHLLEVNKISDAELETYGKELRAVFGFVKYSRDKVKLKQYLEQNEDAFSNLPGVIVDAISELTDSREIKTLMARNDTEQYEKGDGVNMCEALRDWMEDLKNEAMNEGMTKGLTEGREKGMIEGRAEGRAVGRAEGIIEGRKEERENTERERKNAEMERQRADRAEERALRAEEELMKLKAQLGYA